MVHRVHSRQHLSRKLLLNLLMLLHLLLLLVLEVLRRRRNLPRSLEDELWQEVAESAHFTANLLVKKEEKAESRACWVCLHTRNSQIRYWIGSTSFTTTSGWDSSFRTKCS